MRRRVLIVTRDLIPLDGHPTAGGGLRAWGLGEGLRAQGHDVAYSVPRAALGEGEEFDALRALAFGPDDLNTALLRSEAEVVIVEQWGLATYLEDIPIPVVLDLHGSLILENAFREHRSLTSNAAAKIKALHKADLITCPAVRQRAYFMSWMMMSGADPRSIPIEVVPVSMPPELPERTADADGPLSLVFGGQLWPWIEADLGLTTAAAVLEETGAGTCHLFVDEPRGLDLLPHDRSTRVPTRRLPEAVLGSDAVKVEGFLPRGALVERYAGAHLAVDLYGWNPERDLAYTTRTVEYLWCGLPVLCADYGELSELVRRHEAGWVVPADDPAAVRAALEHAVGDRAELQRRSDNARRLVRDNLIWTETVGPLDRFVQDPGVRDKGKTIFGKIALEFDRISSEAGGRIEALEAEVRGLREEAAARDRRMYETGREVVERDRELRRARSQIEALEGQVRALGEDLAAAEERLTTACADLESERSDHGETAARHERSRAELTRARRLADEQAHQIEELRADLRGALERIDSQSRDASSRAERLENELREQGHREQELRRELAAEAAQSERLRAELAAAGQQHESLQGEIEALQGSLRQIKDGWVERTLATGQHSFRRIAVQVPSIAGLFIRNLANNAYMTVWQKRHNLRIFPGT